MKKCTNLDRLCLSLERDLRLFSLERERERLGLLRGDLKNIIYINIENYLLKKKTFIEKKIKVKNKICINSLP